jgi:hypothetical protein
MKLRTIVAATLLAGAALAGPAVHAQAAQPTTPVVLVEDGKGGFSAIFGNSFTAGQTGTFTDTFTFTVDHPDAFTITGSVVSTVVRFVQQGADPQYVNVKGVFFSDFSLHAYDPATGTMGPMLGLPLRTDYPGAYANSFDGAWHLLPGTYAVRVAGNVFGINGGDYSADLAIMPVPEPGEWGMLLAGLGAIGAIARRKRA